MSPLTEIPSEACVFLFFTFYLWGQQRITKLGQNDPAILIKDSTAWLLNKHTEHTEIWFKIVATAILD